MFGLTHKLALSNLLKNQRLYYPFALMSVVSTAIAYIFLSLYHNVGLVELWGADGVKRVMGMGNILVLLVVFLMVLYANAFVIKQRSKEFGLYRILGLEKKHLVYMTSMETQLFAVVTVGVGLLLGILLDSLSYAVLLKLMNVPVQLVATFQWKTVQSVVLAFAGIYLVTSLLNATRLSLSKSLQLVQGKKRGEKKGRLLWLQTLVGLGVLGTAYYMSQNVVAPLQAMNQFFLAVLLVVFATYLLFNAGIISLLRFLQKRASYYYKPANFISVSNLIFRMRKNAMGLATISILSTMVLVTLIGGINIYVGGERIASQDSPNDFSSIMHNGLDENGKLRGDAASVLDFSRQQVQTLDMPIEKEVFYVFRSAYTQSITDNQVVPLSNEEFAQFAAGSGDIAPPLLTIFTQEDYEEMTGEKLSLKDGQVAVYQEGLSLDKSQPLVVNGHSLEIVEFLSDNFTEGHLPRTVEQLSVQRIRLVVKDLEHLLSMEDEAYYVGYETSLSEEEQIQMTERYISVAIGDWDDVVPYAMISPMARAKSRSSYFQLAGSLFFIGIFLALIFFLALILVIYYKQISEGYEDRSRFVTMKQVGLDETEAKRSIRQQLLTVFFLPALVALTHMTFAYKMLRMILELMGVDSTQQIFQVTVVSAALYLVIYLLAYGLTSRSYHQIVK